MTEPVTDPAAGFPEANLALWRRLAARALVDGEASIDETLTRRTADGLARGPLFLTRPDAAPPSAGPAGPPLVCATSDHPDPELAGRQAREAVAGGADALELRIDLEGARGCIVRGRDDLESALDGVDLAATALSLDAGDLALQAAAMTLAVFETRDVAPASARLDIGADPFGRLAARTHPLRDLDLEMADAAGWAFWLADAWPAARTFRADGRVVHEAGGSEAWELAFAASSALAYLEHLVEYDLPLDLAAGQISFALALDADAHLGIAKIRALKRVWTRITAASGVSPEAAGAPIRAYSSNRMLARQDPWTNIIRLTTASFAAICGGADSLTLTSFAAPLSDAAHGDSALARRLSRNIPLVLIHECALARVADPARGSFHHEALTDALARSAWKHFQEIQTAGALERFITDGRLADAVAQTRAARTKAFESGAAKLIGVTAYPPPDDFAEAHPLALEPVDRDAAYAAAEARCAARPAAPAAAARLVPDQLLELARAGADISAMTPAPSAEPEPYYETPLRPIRDAAPFENGSRGG